ncbi:MAG TPA: Rieske 2Fe-2S domain-containing protein [Candidatus Limnocylindria bacterium]|jgi:3-phenylpropionate/trans-cinnamate dioxygenase ferredoxin subunit
MTHESRFVPVADAADIPAGTVGVVGAEGRSFAIGHTADDAWGAVDNICTHDGGTLGEGEIDDRCVECPRHGAKFDLFTGAVRAMPAVFPVNAYPVRLRDGIVEIDLGVVAAELEIG